MENEKVEYMEDDEEDVEERSVYDIANDLEKWAKGGGTLALAGRRRGAISNALYTLSEGNKFEEGSVSVNSALLIHSVIEKILKNGGELPDEFNL